MSRKIQGRLCNDCKNELVVCRHQDDAYCPACERKRERAFVKVMAHWSRSIYTEEDDK